MAVLLSRSSPLLGPLKLPDVQKLQLGERRRGVLRPAGLPGEWITPVRQIQSPLSPARASVNDHSCAG